MSETDTNSDFEQPKEQMDTNEIEMSADDDLLMERILENINATPIGQVLKSIAALPEIRQEKVLGVRQQLNDSKYDLNERLDIALEKVLDELMA